MWLSKREIKIAKKYKLFKMKFAVKPLILSLVIIFTSRFFNLLGAPNPVDYVDPKIGTAIKAKRWMSFPGATTSFGMVVLSPDNLHRTGWYKEGFDPHLGASQGSVISTHEPWQNFRFCFFLTVLM